MDRIAYLTVLLSFIAGLGLSSFYFADLTPKVTINRTEADIHNTNRFDPPRYNYIQANNHKVDYEVTSEGVLVEDIDKLITVYGSSMRPTFFTGHKLMAKDYENQSLEEGMIVQTDSGTVHRIKADYLPTNGFYLLQGDNNERSEEVEPKDVNAVVVGALYSDK